MTDPGGLKHHFLLAMPGLADPNFSSTITYLFDHSEKGAMGLVINRPSELTLGDMFDQLGIEGDHARNSPVLQGGPVERERGFILHGDDVDFDASVDLGHGIRLSTARQVLEAISKGNGPEKFIVALGYAGWEGGQLERELSENTWLSCPANSEVIFETPFEMRVQRAADTLGIDFRLISSQPGHA